MKVPDTKDNVAKCICANCPSYNECMKQGMEGLYCARGRTDCDLKRQGCVCPRCPVAKEYQLFGGYYCVIGGWEEEVGKAIKTLAGVTLIPLKVAADVAGDIGKSIETAIPQPSELVSALIALRISTLKTVTNAIEKEITLLEQYKGDLEAEEGEKKETVKVE
ncbi:MAG: DUF2769 domain-containing protein [Methanomicrobia archaeon]|nr:DUF2769 domain-containing protein [Methanomicrobia archaeon]